MYSFDRSSYFQIYTWLEYSTHHKSRKPHGACPEKIDMNTYWDNLLCVCIHVILDPSVRCTLGIIKVVLQSSFTKSQETQEHTQY